MFIIKIRGRSDNFPGSGQGTPAIVLAGRVSQTGRSGQYDNIGQSTVIIPGVAPIKCIGIARKD